MDTNDVSDVGQHGTHTDVTKKYDANHGTYSDKVSPVPTMDKLPQSSLPQGTDPSPFTLGPMAPGGR